jgi:nucleoside-diphosphate-sugar epimerase
MVKSSVGIRGRYPQEASGLGPEPEDCSGAVGTGQDVSHAADDRPGVGGSVGVEEVVGVITGEKILVTGVSGKVGLPIARYLAENNEVWGLARFGSAGDRAQALVTNPADRDAVEALGIHTVAVDLEDPDLSDVPDDVTYVLHLAHTRLGAQFQRAVQVNAVGAGHVLAHCRNAKAALVVSSTAVYSVNEDPFHAFTEDDDIGRSFAPWAPSSPVAKVSLEAVARFCAEAYSLPTIVMRLNTLYGSMGAMPVEHLDAIARGEAVRVWMLPYPHSVIHIEDMCEQLEALLGAASVPANIVNWCGDEVVTVEEWCNFAAELAGTTADIQLVPTPGVAPGNVSDNSKRMSITGPCRRNWRDSFRQLYAERHGART